MCFVPPHYHLKDINLFINTIFIVSCVHLSIIYISLFFQYFANRVRDDVDKFLIRILVLFLRNTLSGISEGALKHA